MPRGAGGQPVLFQQYDICLVVPRQMIGRRAADDAAADHDELCMGGKGHGYPVCGLAVRAMISGVAPEFTPEFQKSQIHPIGHIVRPAMSVSQP